jgi:glycine/D-amino acid oxidase-like deaminating enzyme
MGTERADAVIVGAGLAGSAAARALASRGRSVVLVEAFQPGHRRGSSHGSARIFRRAYPDPLYVRLTGQAQVLWRQLAAEAGEELVTITGAVDYGLALPAKMYQILAGFGVPAELMKAEAAAERWPGISFGRDAVLYHPDGGVIDPERAMTAMRGIAAARGAQICYGSPVLRVEADDAGATVHTADRSWRAPVVIVAAGAWLEPLLGGQVPLPPLVVTQVQAFHFVPRGPAPWPAFICHDEVVM